MLTGYQISVTAGRVHVYVVARYDVLRKTWEAPIVISFEGSKERLLPPQCFDGLPDFDCANAEKAPYCMNIRATEYATKINNQIGNGPIPQPTREEEE